MRRALLVLAISALGALGACRSSSSSDDAGACPAFFGRPNELTGLTSDQCRPECVFDGSVFAPPDYSPAFVQSLLTNWTVTLPYPPITSDPYASPAPPDDPPGTICAVLPGTADAGPRPYTLVTYASESDARAAGASPTHFGHCGVCSTLSNLAVYMRENDLTGPVRDCGLKGFGDGGEDANVACLQALGFDLPCAQAWYWDTVHTRTVCLAPCIAEIKNPYQLPDGALNTCVQCDEDQSGPIFKAIAGRTRRNSGLPNALCRPCSEVRPLVHDY
jgi:hypothetical protein